MSKDFISGNVPGTSSTARQGNMIESSKTQSTSCVGCEFVKHELLSAWYPPSAPYPAIPGDEGLEPYTNPGEDATDKPNWRHRYHPPSDGPQPRGEMAKDDLRLLTEYENTEYGAKSDKLLNVSIYRTGKWQSDGHEAEFEFTSYIAYNITLNGKCQRLDNDCKQKNSCVVRVTYLIKYSCSSIQRGEGYEEGQEEPTRPPPPVIRILTPDGNSIATMSPSNIQYDDSDRNSGSTAEYPVTFVLAPSCGNTGYYDTSFIIALLDTPNNPFTMTNTDEEIIYRFHRVTCGPCVGDRSSITTTGDND